jgi:hypothetical protein
MNNSEQNALSFERIVFFSDAVFAFILLFAYLLDPTKRVAETEMAEATE